MKGSIVCAFIAVLVGSLAVPQDLASKWETFKAEHGKQYSGDEDAKRMQRFAESLTDIEAHNIRFAADEESFSSQLSRYSDLTDEELNDQLSEFKLVDYETHLTWNNSYIHSLGSNDHIERELPAEYDAEKMGHVTPVKNQNTCAAAYAFAAVALLEAHIKRAKNKTLDLSEQQVIDCTYKKYVKNTMNIGCRGGWSGVTLEHIVKHGITTESLYPYTSGTTNTHGTCQKNKPKANLMVTNLKINFAVRPPNDENKLRLLLVKEGPFMVSLGVAKQQTRSFFDLKDGIYDVPDGHKVTLNHFILIVGYGTENGKPFWRFKNSWGTSWGNGGYGKIARGKNMGNIMGGGLCILASR